MNTPRHAAGSATPPAGTDDHFALLAGGDGGKEHAVSSGTVKMI